MSTSSTKTKLTDGQPTQRQEVASLNVMVSAMAHELGNLNNCITFNIPVLREYLKELIPILDDCAKNYRHFELCGMSYPKFRKDIFEILDNMEHASRRITETVSDVREFATRSSDEASSE